MSRYGFIAAEKAAVRNVATACALLKVSRSAYYQWSQQLPSAHARSESELGERVAAIHGESRGTYGAPRVHQQLRREGVHCARKRVARLMALRGLAGRCRRRFQKTTIPDPLAAVLAPDLVQRSFETAARPLDRVWVGDISYVRTWEGWCYLAPVIDLASRRVVGFALADHMRASLICSALEMAIGVRPSRCWPGLPQRPRQPVHLGCLPSAPRQTRNRAVAQPPAPVLGQRCRRELLRDAQDRAGLPPAAADPRCCPPGRLRVHRGLLQPPAPPLRPRLPLPSRVRSQ